MSVAHGEAGEKKKHDTHRMRCVNVANTRTTQMIFKIVGREAWAAACREGVFRGSLDDVRDGYIHFSTADQLGGTASRYFKGIADLLLIAFDEQALGGALKWEPARGGDLFPHLYGRLPTARALWERPLVLDGDGVPAIPKDVASC